MVCSALFLLTRELFFLLLESFIRIFTHFSSPIALLSRCSAYCCVLLLRFSKNEYDYDYDRVPQCRSAKICYLARLFILYFRSAGFSFRLRLRLLTLTLHLAQNTLFQFLFWQYFITLSLSLHLFSHFSYKLYFLSRFFSIIVIVISPANKNFRFLDRLSPHATSFHLRPRRSTVNSIVEACFWHLFVSISSFLSPFLFSFLLFKSYLPTTFLNINYKL